MNDITNELKKIFGDRLKENEPLSKHVNFRIGGPARWFAEAKTVEEIKSAITFSNENGFSFEIMGGGSNTLPSDKGFDGLVIKLAMRDIKIDGNTVIADAGAISAAVARQTANAGLGGMAWAISLPGTIGGAVRGNAGCFGGETKDYLTKIEVLRDGKVVELTKDQLAFDYRESALKHNKDIVLRATFELPSGDKDELKKQLSDTLAKRKASQPLHAGSAGCIFKNYDVTDDELEKLKKKIQIPEAMEKSKRLSAGFVIDQLGLKGTKIGDTMISEEHGNFVINLGHSTSDEVVQLISMVKTKARNELGIQLHEEIKYLGF